MGGIYLDNLTFRSGISGQSAGTLDASSLLGDDTDYTFTVPAVEFGAFTLALDFDGVRILSVDGNDRENVEDLPIIAVNGTPDGDFFFSSSATIINGGFAALAEPDVYIIGIDLGPESELVVGSTLATIEFSTTQDPFSSDTDTFAIVLGDPTADISVTCFAHGTGIATPDGERAVERLRPGDPILTADGRTVSVKWIGRQTRNKLFTPEDRLRPVRVAAGALGPGVPHSDLILTADHALILDGLAINAGALVNGTTIMVEPMAALDFSITYYHLETGNHEVILANGAPAETFVDYIGRATFDNYAEFIALHGNERPVAEMDIPRISAARLVPPAISARLNCQTAA
ncbi:Hint domain-containing protein [Cribrihabitans sp. XS_ASV171]